MTRIEKPYNKWQVFFLGYFCIFELCGPEIGHLIAVQLTAKRGSHKFQKYGQKRRLLSYRQIIFLAVPESYFAAEFRSIPFRASEWALPRNSEFRRNEHFFPRNNGILSEAIPLNFFGTKFRCQPYPCPTIRLKPCPTICPKPCPTFRLKPYPTIGPKPCPTICP